MAETTIALANDTKYHFAIPDDGVTYDRQLIGTAEAGASVAIFDQAILVGTVIADASGAWSSTPDVPDGAHLFTAVATHAAGHLASSPALAVTFDTSITVPTVALVNDTGTPVDGITSDATLIWTGEPNSAVVFNDNNFPFGGSAVPPSGSASFDV